MISQNYYSRSHSFYKHFLLTNPSHPELKLSPALPPEAEGKLLAGQGSRGRCALENTHLWDALAGSQVG